MSPFNHQDIADYYDQTLHHYQRWWKLEDQLCVHYGFWNQQTYSFTEALKQTMKEMAMRVEIQDGMKILDAGCGVGGASFYLSDHFDVQVEGITLSEKQLALAKKVQGNRFSQIRFSRQDFSKTNFPDESFDRIWACESSCYAHPKSDFLKEAFRLLKPGGRLVIADYFTTSGAYRKDRHNSLKKWAQCWAITELYSEENLEQIFLDQGFEILINDEVSQHIRPSSRRMYWASMVGAIPSILYNLTHKVSRFGANHYQSGFYQYKALRKQLWHYRILTAQKK